MYFRLVDIFDGSFFIYDGNLVNFVVEFEEDFVLVSVFVERINS